MIYNLEKEISLDVLRNGVYESLSKPTKGEGLGVYLDRISDELIDCPYLHAPDYDLLIPISKEIKVLNPVNDNIYYNVTIICSSWWHDEN